MKEKNNQISMKDYIRMWRVKGIRLPIQYFFQNHLFDIIWGTDTHYRLEKKDYQEKSVGFESGVLYMSSVTREFKNSIYRIKHVLGERFFDYQYFDLGCGKGKTMLIYSRLFGKNIIHKAIGIDYYKPLIVIANKNLRITGLSSYAFANYDDARHFKNYVTSHSLILYLYNPFGEKILKDVLESCSDYEIYIIYTDPVHQKLVQDMGFKILFAKKGQYSNTTTSIFFREREMVTVAS